MSDIQHAQAQGNHSKAKLQMVLSKLLDNVSDDDLNTIQTQVDEMELSALAEGHHDHDHPTRA
ncbi:hypothetical protein [Janthinobacterium agaricidamnosum]|uniref:Uncharacterized protein n=1 Tax=Janthinobacterium agaricidamnosum NBRC 102515 = DSM 9628 TaxID=1349767 RepID=W0V613_9BURK|nr:hypothetical protein [Janthinobacterium agaricidamnosum]CDG83020.1 hypothetical protein GJA_2387 [Janthinobacterium agaricidamnosum NBRC 102515 = DSM 9628]